MASQGSSGGAAGAGAAATGETHDLEALEAAFRAGVADLMGSWTALQMALADEWGGPDSEAKACELEEDVHEWFVRRGGRAVKFMHELDELLLFGMYESFDADIADGSCRQLAAKLCKLHTACCDGNLKLAAKISSAGKAKRAVDALAKSMQGLTAKDGDDGDAGRSAAGGKGKEGDDEGAAAGREREPKPEPEPLLTEEEVADGWEVPKKGRRRRG